ncbi:Auxin Efflux Carrier [Methylocella silvestris BL2]|uniref:Auxin Efflux Carrier n=1 Tax=Methylocella silvestris (strain DSM 15510 / CIP 108128 / LMG 27833 / NCIMB 13906 / BL2) TaxID=395965 RepID=B8EKI0_METSB|nr:AEC family transporter [Methylocella silvestris]ACK51350.1 Auxin Efflux Carrier [Methylocella silvestris BL2]
MLSAFGAVIPIFALIVAGVAIRRWEILGPGASRELNRFVVFLALPALLFDIMAHASWSSIWQPGFIGAFGLSSAIVFALAVAVRLAAGRPLADAGVDGLNAAYGNTGYIGIPLCLVALGPASQTGAVIATIFTACVLFGGAIVLIEIGLQAEKRIAPLIFKVAKSLLRNPLVAAPAAGALINALGFKIPDQAEVFFKLLGSAASPCALVALGLFFAGGRDRAEEAAPKREAAAAAFLIGLKLIAQPLIAFLLVEKIFALEPVAAKTAVVMAALPTGTGSFMLAEYYRLDAGLTSKVILISTALSAVTIAAYLGFAGR